MPIVRGGSMAYKRGCGKPLLQVTQLNRFTTPFLGIKLARTGLTPTRRMSRSSPLGEHLTTIDSEEVTRTMAGQSNNAPQMPIKGIQTYGSATGKPVETSKTIYGDDLRSGGGKVSK